MRMNTGLVVTLLLMSIMLGFLACEPSTNTTFEESFQEIKQVTPIAGITVESLEISKKDDQDSYLTVRLNNGTVREAWCIEWNEEESFGIQNDAKLYSTKGHEDWKKLNHFMRIKNDLRADDPDLTSREIQVVIWSLIDNPSFDVDKISEYENIDPRVFKDGQPLFDVQKVKNIVKQVETNISSKPKAKHKERGVTVIQNDGQTLIVEDETAFAVKTLGNGQKEVDSDYSTCFNEEIIEKVSFNNWGWTNGPISDPSGNLTFDIYAGAGQCDLNKGTLVGELTANYSNGTLTVTYRMTETSDFSGNLYTLTETHLYVGNEPYPMNRGGKYTVAPGQYDNKNDHDDVTEYTYEVNDLSGDIYFIAHSVVNGFNPEAD